MRELQNAFQDKQSIPHQLAWKIFNLKTLCNEHAPFGGDIVLTAVLNTNGSIVINLGYVIMTELIQFTITSSINNKDRKK